MRRRFSRSYAVDAWEGLRRLGLACIVAALAIALSGCNAITGIDEYHTATTLGASPDAPEEMDAPADNADVIVFETNTIDSGVETSDLSETAPPDAPPGDAACPTHTNGLGGTFVDCAPLGTPGDASTYSIALAEKARASWSIPIGSGDQESTCTDGTRIVYRYAATQTAAWAYAGPLAGHVTLRPTSGAPWCPTASDPTWR